MPSGNPMMQELKVNYKIAVDSNEADINYGKARSVLINS
jgi:hypothetical protein